MIRAALLTLALLAGSARAETLAVIHARALLDPANPPVEDAAILISDGKVQAAGPGLQAPSGARIIDAGGRLVTPGLMNGGTQLGLVEVSAVSDTTDQAVSSGPLGPAFDIEFALNPNSTLIPRARTDGLTRAGVYPSGSATAPFTGEGAALRLSEGPDLIDRPRAMMFTEIGGFAAGKAGGSRSAAWVLLRNALGEARSYARTAPSGRPRDQLLDHLDIEALQPVISGRMPLAVMASRESDIRQAIRLVDDYGVKVVVFGGQEAWRAAPELAARHVPVVLDPFDDLPWTFDQIGARLDNAAILDKAGVIIAFSVPGVHFSHDAGEVVREAAGVAAANGLPWGEAMKALTSGPAAIWGVGDHYGRLAAGQDADLVIWDGDPLEPASRPTLVLVRGRPVSLDTRQDALARRYAPSKLDDPWPAEYRK